MSAFGQLKHEKVDVVCFSTLGSVRTVPPVSIPLGDAEAGVFFGAAGLGFWRVSQRLWV